MTRTFPTNLRCAACVEAVRPGFDTDPGVTNWSADVTGPVKTITVAGPAADRDRVNALLARAGYAVIGDAVGPATMPPPAAPPGSYYPLALLGAFLAGSVTLFELSQPRPDAMRAMTHFMAVVFLAFSFFKLLDLRAFAAAYATYDLVAARSRLYALAYPFIELGLGLAYLTGTAPMAASAITLVVMLVSLVGVGRTLLSGRTIRCACLGTGFDLPMSAVTLVEDGAMAVMAAVMLVV